MITEAGFAKGWKAVSLADCCEIVSGSTPRRDNPKYWNGDIPWVTPKDLSGLEHPVLDDAPEYITQAGFKSCSTQMLPKGAVLFSSRAPIGLVAIAGKSMCTNQGFKSLVPMSSLESRYLYWCMRWMVPRVQQLGSGATFKEVSRAVMARIEIPLPPLSEQKRIADILDKADAIRRKRQEAVDELLSLPGSAFHDMFGSPSHNTKGWDIGTIRELVSEVKYGTSSKAGTEGKFPILRMNNITYAGTWDLSDLKYIDIPAKDEPKYLVEKGDILFNRTNSKELVGKTAVFQEETPMAFAGYLVRARTTKNAHPDYIAGYLNSPHGKATLRHMCKSIIGMANINAQEFQDIRIPQPPIEAQLEYVQVLDAVRASEKPLRATLAEADDLFNSLVQRAFKGEL